MAKRRAFEVGNFYHVFSRGVNKCDIFKDDLDYYLFQKMLKSFNTSRKIKLGRLKKEREKKDEKRKLVEVYCYILMPNHFHLILQELVEGGISLYLHKVLGPYSNFFNKKYLRVGALFGARFKDKLIDSDEYFRHLVVYIWNNPVKLIRYDYDSKDLLDGLITLSKKEQNFAENYPYKYFSDESLRLVQLSRSERDTPRSGRDTVET